MTEGLRGWTTRTQPDSQHLAHRGAVDDWRPGDLLLELDGRTLRSIAALKRPLDPRATEWECWRFIVDEPLPSPLIGDADRDPLLVDDADLLAVLRRSHDPQWAQQVVSALPALRAGVPAESAVRVVGLGRQDDEAGTSSTTLRRCADVLSTAPIHSVLPRDPASSAELHDMLFEGLSRAGVASLGPGDSLLTLLRATSPEGLLTSAAAVDALLAPPGASTAPRLRGATEVLAEEGHAFLASVRRLAVPLEPFGVMLVDRIALPLSPGSSSAVLAWQAAVWTEPPSRHGWRLDSLPPLVWIFALVDEHSSSTGLDHVADVLHRGRARVARDHYLVQAGGRTDGRPASWADGVLEASVDLVHDFGGVNGSSDEAARLFGAATRAKARLSTQHVQLHQRHAGAEWKSQIHDRDIDAVLSGVSDAQQRERTAYALGSPSRHYVLQLGEVSGHLLHLDSRANDLFAVVSALASKNLLAKTESARRLGVVAGVFTALLATAGVFAAMAAIPLAEERSLNPLTRTVAVSGAVVVGAAMMGLILALSTSLRRTSTRTSVEVRLLGPPEATPLWTLREGSVVVLGMASLLLFIVAASRPSLIALAAAAALTVTAVLLQASTPERPSGG